MPATGEALVFGVDAEVEGVAAGLWVECVGATGAVVLGVCAVLVGEGAAVVDEVCIVDVVLDGVVADDVGDDTDVDDETLVVVVFALSELLDPHAVNDTALIAMTAEMTLLRISGSFVVLDTFMTQVTSRWFHPFQEFFEIVDGVGGE